MTAARLPDDGELSLGSVRLSAGRRVITEDGQPVAWVTEDIVPGPGRVWAALRTDQPNGVWIGSVLRSFEKRFGARLVKIGPRAEIRLLVERPPLTLQAALRIAVELRAFADEFPGLGTTDVRQMAAGLVGTPGWTFWWD